jgi:hypothetical protein
VKEALTLYQTLLTDSSISKLLLKLDEDLADKCRKAGCRCGGRLHRSNYPRKPRGNLPKTDEDYSWRHSFCCDQQGCRRRHTPASFRFLGRKVFVSAVVILITALRHGSTPKRMARLRRMVGVSRRTVERWRKWWLCSFTQSPFWKAARGRFHLPVDEEALPLSLLNSFRGRAIKEMLIALLRFLLPLTVPRSRQDF